MTFRRMISMRGLVLGAAFAASTALGALPAFATTIVFFGASQTYGKGVARGQDFPSQLAEMLKARGIAVNVVNAGKNGETTHHMVKRLDHALTPDTRVVVFQPGSNDAAKGHADERAGNIDEIRSELKDRGIAIVMVPNSMFHDLPRGPDGQHLTPEGYHQLAEELLPKIEAALHKG